MVETGGGWVEENKAVQEPGMIPRKGTSSINKHQGFEENKWFAVVVGGGAGALLGWGGIRHQPGR